MARAAQIAGDPSGAATLVSTLGAKYGPLWPWPWEPAEAGWLLRAVVHGG